MLKSSQYAALPGTARAIVDTDRSISAVMQRRVIPLEAARPGGELRELLKDRRTLTKRADDLWGRPLGNDGSAKA